MHLTLTGDTQRLMSLLMEIGLVILGQSQKEPLPPNEVHIPLNTPEGATWLHLHLDPEQEAAVIMTLDALETDN